LGSINVRYTAGAPLPSKLAEYAEAVASLDDGRRRQFYETLAHNLTVCARAIWSDERLSDAEKVDQMKWLNEIQHRVIGKLRAAEPWPDEEFFEGVLRARTDECPPLRGHVGWAVKQSYEYAAAERPAV
jgi:hypothetical protein